MTVTFIFSNYNYTEDHGEVSDIHIQLSNTIAQSLEVNYSGGERLDYIQYTASELLTNSDNPGASFVHVILYMYTFSHSLL